MIDNNPGLPNMSSIIYSNKYILELDPSDSLFVSSRKNRTIRDYLIHSKLKPLNNNDNIIPAEYSNNGCFGCEKCYMCRHYLFTSHTFTSFHTNQVFHHLTHITCANEGVIYIINCITCKVSYIGYNIGKMVLRLSNDKSHIKYSKKTCEITKHFIEIDHKLDYSNKDSLVMIYL